jgi:kumamolisin
MQRSSIVSLRTPLSLASILFLFAATISTFSFAQPASAAQVNNASVPYVALDKSYIKAPAGATRQNQQASSSPLTISLVLQPNNSASLNNELNAIYTPGSQQYHKWLATGAFNKLYGPTAAQTAQVTSFLQSAGLKLGTSPSPFIVRATGSTAQIEAAFHTTINNYKASNGTTFFQNDTTVQVPASLSSIVSEVTGLSNTEKVHTNTMSAASGAKATTATKATTPQVQKPAYGAGPGGSGLVPAQLSSLYEANAVHNLGARGQGRGTNLAVFELSGYTQSDIVAYEHQFFGASENVPIVNVNVDGGPLTPICQAGDTCTPNDYSGDIEVNADIETQIALAPKASHIYVYNAPNDYLGTTIIDEYMRIANDNSADSISSSWGACELDTGFAQAKAESIAFEQMALQGQSMFSAAGDTGAYDCLRDIGSPNLNSLSVDDPSSQPYVTAVGGTSFGSYNPGTNLNPSYHQESVWNVGEACTPSTVAGNPGCNNGTGGGGVSIFWAQPGYQHGPGVINSYSKTGAYCNAPAGQYCREIPDVSANADQYTPYAEYCTGNPTTNSYCAQLPSWFGIGGTSLSSPVWSAVIGLWDSTHGLRFGNANYGLYQAFRTPGLYSWFYHDITGKGQTDNTNGYYPTTLNYDIATGIGTPRISELMTYDFWKSAF